MILKILEKLGRKKKKVNSPRICDIDILDYDQKIIKKKDSTYSPLALYFIIASHDVKWFSISLWTFKSLM